MVGGRSTIRTISKGRSIRKIQNSAAYGLNQSRRWVGRSRIPVDNLYVYSKGHLKRDTASFPCAFVYAMFVTENFPMFSLYSLIIILVLYVEIRGKVKQK